MINIKTDSRKVVKGDTFVAIKGYTVDGHDFIESAISNGAVKIICEHGDYSVPTLRVKNTTKYLAEYLKNNFDLPDHREEELYANWHDDFKLYEKELNEYINIANKKIGENAKDSTSNNRR